MLIQLHQMWPGDPTRRHEFVAQREFKTGAELARFFDSGDARLWLDDVASRHPIEEGAMWEVCQEESACFVWSAKAEDGSEHETKLAVDAAVALAQL